MVQLQSTDDCTRHWWGSGCSSSGCYPRRSSSCKRAHETCAMHLTVCLGRLKRFWVCVSRCTSLWPPSNSSSRTRMIQRVTWFPWRCMRSSFDAGMNLNTTTNTQQQQPTATATTTTTTSVRCQALARVSFLIPHLSMPGGGEGNHRTANIHHHHHHSSAAAAAAGCVRGIAFCAITSYIVCFLYYSL